MPGWATLRNSDHENDGFGSVEDDARSQSARSHRSQREGLAPSSSGDLESWDTSFGGAVLGDDNISPSPDRYIVSGAPPPCGQGAPKSPNEFLSLLVTCTRKHPDATGQNVIWYDLSIRTTTHMWTVTKRFSDLAQFDGNLAKLKLERFKADAKDERGAVPKAFPPPFPSKFHLRANDNRSLVEERRRQLDAYLKEVLRYVQALTLSAIGCKKPYVPQLRAAFALMVECLRTSSQSEVSDALGAGPWSKDDPYSSSSLQVSQQSLATDRGGRTLLVQPPSSAALDRRRSSFASPLRSGCSGSSEPNSSDAHPPCRIVKDQMRFTILFLLPGVTLSDVFVDTTSDRSRKVIIGGKWNSHIFGPQSLTGDENGDLMQMSTSARTATSSGGGADEERRSTTSTTLMESSGTGSTTTPLVSARRGKRSVLMDTFPKGSFEMVFEVPHPFEPAHWYSEYEAGVLFIMWNAPNMHVVGST